VGNVASGAPAPAPAPQKNVIAQTPTAPAPQAPNPGPNAKKNPPKHHPPLHHVPIKSTVKGVVVHVNPVADSYAVASDDGQLIAVHATDLPDPGSKVSVGLRQLFNGSYAERTDREEKGTQADVDFSGTVTYRDPVARTYTVSVDGASVLVHLPKGAPASDLPPLVNEVTVSATVKPLPGAHSKRHRSSHKRSGHRVGQRGHHAQGAFASIERALKRVSPKAIDPCTNDPVTGPAPSSALEQKSVTVEGPPVGSVHVEGIVERACPADQELELSADDTRESRADIVASSPETIDLSLLEVGNPVSATVQISEDGTYDLTGVSRDDGTDGASDSASGQGDQASTKRAAGQLKLRRG
jgi:hypothetical protein